MSLTHFLLFAELQVYYTGAIQSFTYSSHMSPTIYQILEINQLIIF